MKMNLFRVFSILSLLVLFMSPLAGSVRFRDGFYGGGLLGWERFGGQRSDYAEDSEGIFSGSTFNQCFRTNKLDYELIAGCQAVFPDRRLVLGLEPFGSYKLDKATTHLSLGGFGQEFQIKRTWDFGVAARIGYILNESWLIYLLLGPEVGYFKFMSEYSTDLPEDTRVTQNQWLWGVRCGGGIERSWDWVNCSLQITHTRFCSHTFSGSDGDPISPETFSTYLKPRVLAVSLRLTFPLPIRRG